MPREKPECSLGHKLPQESPNSGHKKPEQYPPITRRQSALRRPRGGQKHIGKRELGHDFGRRMETTEFFSWLHAFLAGSPVRFHAFTEYCLEIALDMLDFIVFNT
jgi:hypothetical protein